MKTLFIAVLCLISISAAAKDRDCENADITQCPQKPVEDTVDTGTSPKAPAALVYICDGDQVRLALTLKANSVKVVEENDMSIDSYTLTRDVDYKPRNGAAKIAYKGKNDFASRTLVLTQNMLEGGTKLRNGSMGGFGQIRGSEDSYWSENLTCFRK